MYLLFENHNPPPPPFPPEKRRPLFPSNSPLKVEFLSSPPFLKIRLEVQPERVPAKMEGVHTTYKFSESSKNSFSKCVMEINVSHLYQEKLNYVNGRVKTFLNPTIILSAI